MIENQKKNLSPIRIQQVRSAFEPERLSPYHFKGSAVTELWQTVAYLASESGAEAVGLGTQSVLWSDAKVFANHTEQEGNALMYALSKRALQMLKGNSFTNPITLVDELLPEIYAYGKKITGNPDLRKTFALNALVCVDNAAWLLYAKENDIHQFDEMIPVGYQCGLSYRHSKVASIPAFSVGAEIEKIKAAAEDGYFMMKLKIGSAGAQEDMLEKDMAFMEAVHQAIGHYETAYTENGKIAYYFDANGRYEQKETLMRFLDQARKIGAFEQIAVVEEPFGEENETYVGDLGVLIAADESAHTHVEAAERFEQGYTALAVKAIAKTLSMTLKMIRLASEKNIPCFCADLTVNPVLVDWNKNIAARLSPFPGISVGLLETNGQQYYQQWERLRSYHPMNDGSWAKTQDGLYPIDSIFYNNSGGIFQSSDHYNQIVADVAQEL
uniref:Mandelate racemase/muconate lactonizing enzyme family protein n=1 Tax=Roseihalotalea indica TaxID=2867963 RepID=A0AA49GP40_9BACT|nr:mandelate racemase/muconate lactonizing enzyme family protein [Tunicatimonas sp. TK19036]